MRVLQVCAAGIGTVVLFASTAAAGPESSPRTRVTIRGTGSAVSIERTQEPGRGLTREVHLPPGPLGDAIAMKLEGADDATVIALLRRRQGDLPPVIEAADVKLLRQAGASKSVTQFLASLAAVDLGPMGEGWEVVTVFAPPPPEMEVPIYGMSYGYAVPGGYGYAPFAPFAPGRPFAFGQRPFRHFRPVSFHAPVLVRRPIATHAGIGRLDALP